MSGHILSSRVTPTGTVLAVCGSPADLPPEALSVGSGTCKACLVILTLEMNTMNEELKTTNETKEQ